MHKLVFNFLIPAVVCTVLFAACNGAETEGNDVLGEVAQSCEIGTPAADWTYPQGPYGKDVGEKFEAFTMTDCDGNQASFSDILGASNLVMVNVSAGWCPECIEESRKLESEFSAAYCSRGFHIVQILFEDEAGSPANQNFCQQWRGHFGITFPVVMDPDFTMEYYASAGQMPLNLLIDKDGVIRYRATGADYTNLHQNIDSLLPAQ